MAPCAWNLDPGEGECADWPVVPDEVKATAILLASHFMWAATGRRYGACEISVRPCQPLERGPSYRTYPVLTSHGDGGGIAFPYVDTEGVWRNCGCGPSCACDARFQIELAGPVAAVTEVLVDGAAVLATAYRVDVARGIWLLVRTDGTPWPRTQDFDVDAGVGFFQVTYVRGDAIPAHVLGAAAILACEYAKALRSDADCRLPQRVQSITRQGVAVEVDPTDNADMGYVTGIPEVDQVVNLENPTRLTGRPAIYSPDLPTRGDRRTVIAVGT
ncbi:MAG: hypothetical protein ACRD0W_05680 [Acidimicrobiales bacterium]